MNYQNWTALIVEDEDDSAQVVSQVLEHYGMQIQVARNGAECLEMLTQFEPTIVIMDLAMPHLDGWQTLASMRSSTLTAHIPVIAVTAYHSVEVAEDARRAGFNAYFAKPIDIERFISQVEQVISGH
ncbi:MAG: hypothetical protein Kow00124_09330 [Anaerolineae bacterium]